MQATAARDSGFAAAVRSAASSWDLLVAITTRDLKVRYQGAILSYMWWIARPLALGGVMYFALGRVARLGIDNYPVFLLTALFPWFWFATSIQQGATSFAGNGGLLKKVNFPRIVLPLSAVFMNTIQFVLTLPVLMLFVFIAAQGSDQIDGFHATWLLGIPILLLLQLALQIGLCTFLASANVFSRDLAPLLEVVMRLLFYMSPIIYSMDLVPDQYRPILMLNPIAPLLDAWRQLFMGGTLPDSDIWPAVVFAGAALVLGLGLYRLTQRYFADAL